MILPNARPLISIALPTYNAERYLSELLDSLLAQTYPRLEIVVVDDKSTDTTLCILQQYSSLYPHIKVYANESNMGYIKNFERAIGFCSGEYVAICDQDDVWLPNKISRKADEIGNFPMIYCDSFVTNDRLQKTGKKISDAVVCKTYTNCLNCVVYANIYGHTCMFRRSVYLASSVFPECISHDWWLGYNALLMGGAKFLPEPLVLYRQHENNQFGIVGGKKRKHNRIKKGKIIADARERIQLFYKICPDRLEKEKKVLYQLKTSYNDFSLANNFLRMTTFFGNYEVLLAVKKRNKFRKLLFCFKMFVKLR